MQRRLRASEVWSACRFDYYWCWCSCQLSLPGAVAFRLVSRPNSTSTARLSLVVDLRVVRALVRVMRAAFLAATTHFRVVLRYISAGLSPGEEAGRAIAGVFPASSNSPPATSSKQQYVFMGCSEE